MRFDANRKLLVINEKTKRVVHIDTIAHFEASVNYTIIHLTNFRTITIPFSLAKINLLLADFEFIRFHRSFLVNKKSITEITESGVCLRGVYTLPISRRFRIKLKL
jgi:two-component system, LytTR family, response regulator